jgi:plastocyanin
MARLRRDLLRLGGLTVAGALAGCTSGSSTDTPAGADGTDTPARADSETPTSGGGGGNPPGADVVGGPDDLRSSPTVEAAVLDEDQGAGEFVFTPAVIWVEAGATVTWEIQGAAHSVRAYHADNDRPHRVPEGPPPFDSGTVEAGETYERTFETTGVHNYFCRPHEGLGMVGIVVVEEPAGGPGTTAPADLSGPAAEHIAMQLEAAGIESGKADGGANYDWATATFDAYWYSLYNMSTNISMSGNGVLFPHNDEQRQQFRERLPKMLEAANQDRPPVNNPNLTMAPFTEGDPHFTQEPVFSDDSGRPDASTLTWDASESSKVVSPSAVAWTHLKGVTWAKNFQNHFDVLPDSLAAEFRSEVLATLAQIGTAATLVKGGPDANGALTKSDETLLLVSEFAPGRGEVVDDASRPHHHAAMLWFLSDLTSLAHGGWFGYENPEPLVPPENVQKLTDGMAKTTMNAFDPGDVGARATRDLGVMLGALGWYGTHAGNADLEANAAAYADGVAAEVESNLAGNGKVETDGNQAAAQGAIGQGLLWASQVDGVDHADTAEDVLGYLLEELWTDDAGIFAASEEATTHRYTARDAGDVTGGLNAADAVLEMDGVKPRFARFFDETFNRGRLQRAERPPSRDESAEHTLPLPPAAGGEFGQAAVYNGEVAYDADADEWSVTDDRFYTGDALYLANQDIWVGHWGGDFFRGRGVPGTNDSPE